MTHDQQMQSQYVFVFSEMKSDSQQEKVFVSLVTLLLPCLKKVMYNFQPLMWSL